MEDKDLETRLVKIEPHLKQISDNTRPYGCAGSFDRIFLGTLLAGALLYQFAGGCLAKDIARELRKAPLPIYDTNTTHEDEYR